MSVISGADEADRRPVLAGCYAVACGTLRSAVGIAIPSVICPLSLTSVSRTQSQMVELVRNIFAPLRVDTKISMIYINDIYQPPASC